MIENIFLKLKEKRKNENKEIELINKLIGYLIKNGKKKKFSNIFNISLEMLSNNYFINPLNLINMIIYNKIKSIKIKRIFKKNRFKRMTIYIPLKFRLKKAIQSVIKINKFNKKKFKYSILISLTLIDKAVKKKFKLKKKKFNRKFIIPFLKRIMNRRKKKRKNLRKKEKKKYKIKRTKLISKRKNPNSYKKKIYI